MRRKEQYADEIIERMELMKNGGWATYIDKPTKDAVIECCQNCVESWCGRHKDHVVTDVRAIKEAEQTEPNCSENPNNCEDEPQTCEECEHWNDVEDGCAERHGCKTEPQTDCAWK